MCCRRGGEVGVRERVVGISWTDRTEPPTAFLPMRITPGLVHTRLYFCGGICTLALSVVRFADLAVVISLHVLDLKFQVQSLCLVIEQSLCVLQGYDILKMARKHVRLVLLPSNP